MKREKRMKTRYCIVFCVLTGLAASCATAKAGPSTADSALYHKLLRLENNTRPIREQYPDMRVIDYGNNKAYEFRNANADTLIIFMGGSGYTSPLGWEENNRFKGYSETINPYLSQHRYAKIVIVGDSEGDLVLPRVYKGIANKAVISGLVSVAGGGLSTYERSKILEHSTLPGWNEADKVVFKN